MNPLLIAMIWRAEIGDDLVAARRWPRDEHQQAAAPPSTADRRGQAPAAPLITDRVVMTNRLGGRHRQVEGQLCRHRQHQQGQQEPQLLAAQPGAEAGARSARRSRPPTSSTIASTASTVRLV